FYLPGLGDDLPALTFVGGDSPSRTSHSPKIPPVARSNFAQKKASVQLASAFKRKSIGFCGRLNVVRDKRNEGILLTVGELPKTLQQFAFVK
ncbi:hypothetical protein, partial [Pseudomonas poae]|uniref:hypothetical protein n=1 Tax=Pseudomonas poae TaxID=200451 RepID=UPI0034D5A3A8